MTNKNGSLFVGLFALLAFVAPLRAQTPTVRNPDCAVRTYTFTSTGVSGDVDNTGTDCLTWVMDYSAVGFSAISMQFEAAPAATIGSVSGIATAGTYVIWGGTITNGVNPVIVSPGAGSTRFTDTSTTMTQGYFASFVHVNVTSVTGTGVIKVALYGFRGGPDANTSGGGTGGCVGTTSTPCVVDGPTASGMAPTTPPVLVAGEEPSGGSPGPLHTLETDTVGRVVVVGPSAAAAAVAGAPVLRGADDGTNAQYVRSASAVSLAAQPSIGAQLVEKGPRFSVLSHPSTNSQATASQAAGASGVHHVADCVAWSGASVLAPALTFIAVSLRDGATGAGTILQQWGITIDASVGQNVVPFEVCGLGLMGSSATAMTLEFSAGVTNLAQTAMITGYDVQ